MIFPQDLDHWFSYHACKAEQVPRFQAIRSAARDFAQVILNNTPTGQEQVQAIWNVRMVVAAANASIACEADSVDKQGAA